MSGCARVPGSRASRGPQSHVQVTHSRPHGQATHPSLDARARRATATLGASAVARAERRHSSLARPHVRRVRRRSSRDEWAAAIDDASRLRPGLCASQAHADREDATSGTRVEFRPPAARDVAAQAWERRGLSSLSPTERLPGRAPLTLLVRADPTRLLRPATASHQLSRCAIGCW